MNIETFAARLGVEPEIVRRLEAEQLISLRGYGAVEMARRNNRVISRIEQLRRELRIVQGDEAARAAAVEKLKTSDAYRAIVARRAKLDAMERQLVEDVLAGAN